MTDTTFSISVIICTHNPRPNYFARVLTALRCQTLSMNQWELVIIDNASSEPLTAARWDLSWHPSARILREEELGLSAARKRGILEAAGGLLVFVDDDNVLDLAYLAEALRICNEWPQLGVWGGSIVPEFEVEPPGYLREFLGALALREVESPRWSNVMACLEAQPWGAGLCVRPEVSKAYLEHCSGAAIQLTGRHGKGLLSGEDVEICNIACTNGFGMGLFPNLRVLHIIPKERISEDYLVKVTEGIHTSAFLLAYKWQGIYPRSLIAGLGLLSRARDILYHRGLHRRMYVARLRGYRRRKTSYRYRKSSSQFYKKLIRSMAFLLMQLYVKTLSIPMGSAITNFTIAVLCMNKNYRRARRGQCDRWGASALGNSTAKWC
jgi:glycosyltransferase involved in cell wall biosynthesis